MKILLTADPHLNYPVRNRHSGLTFEEQLSRSINEENPDAVVVAGDIGTPPSARESVASLRQVVGDRKLAFCLGNHDFWIRPEFHSAYPDLQSIVDQFWVPAAREFDAVLLDEENADWGEVVIVGGYGHFDLGLAIPNLEVEGVPITRDVYLSGGMGRLFWNDFAMIPGCAASLDLEAKRQAEGLALRLDQASAEGGQRVMVAVHTCPWVELRGHPKGRGLYDILSAYSGNSLVGEVLAARGSLIDLAFCGHTHYRVPTMNLHGVPCLNVGSEYGVYVGVIYDSTTREKRWCGIAEG